MDPTVQIRIADPKELDISMREVKRYLGYARVALDDGDEEMVTGAIERVRPLLAPKACYCRYSLSLSAPDTVVLPYGSVQSSHLYGNLEGCSEVWIFAATIGAAFDRQLARESLRSMTEAALMQAVGAAAIEAVCDGLNEELIRVVAEEGKECVRRYSPGYGNFALENQKGVFALLNPAKRIGLSLTDSLLMKPEKSVTALIGIKEKI